MESRVVFVILNCLYLVQMPSRSRCKEPGSRHLYLRRLLFFLEELPGVIVNSSWKLNSISIRRLWRTLQVFSCCLVACILDNFEQAVAITVETLKRRAALYSSRVVRSEKSEWIIEKALGITVVGIRFLIKEVRNEKDE